MKKLTMMHNPAHPGELLQGWLADLNLSITNAAEHLGVGRVTLSRVLNCHAAVSADMDLRLSQALGTSQGYWLRLQTNRDAWLASQLAAKRKPIARFSGVVEMVV
jgi:antitoxin HigA-1